MIPPKSLAPKETLRPTWLSPISQNMWVAWPCIEYVVSAVVAVSSEWMLSGGGVDGISIVSGG